LVRLGQVEEGIAQILKGLGKMASIELRLYSTGIRSALALGQAKAGRPEEGLATLEKTLAQMEETGERYWGRPAAEREIIGAEGDHRSSPFVGEAGQGGGGVAGFAADRFLVYRRI
jgi:predicted ATPase